MFGFKHYGIKRKSGRYPWGSGGNVPTGASFLEYYNARKHIPETQIAEEFGMTTTDLRRRKTLAVAEKRAGDVATAIRLKDKGMSNTAIGVRMGINESSVRSLLDNSIKQKSESTAVAADMLKTNVDKYKYIDVGAGVERHIGISRTKLDTAVLSLEDKGYQVYKINVTQVGTGKQTNMKVLTKADVDYKELVNNKDKIKLVNHQIDDKAFVEKINPISISSKRVKINYHEEGGTDKDGVIELRPGVADISLGYNKYAQVRIAVDGKSYMKGMAMYKDDMPDGIDIIYNTNKRKGTPPEKVFKPMTDDPDNPFGAIVKQRFYTDSSGVRQTSKLNIVNEEGSWADWSKSISSQVLGKQDTSLVKSQLDIAYNKREKEYQEIQNITNPTVKKKLLQSFSDGCDKESVGMKAAALPRQGTHVILPFPKLKDTEVYAPNYKNGEKVVLIRYPHGGIFEIPELTVNNKFGPAKKILGQAIDAIGINARTAEQLSGADFDGDTVLVIPNNNKLIKTSKPLAGLKDFDPKVSYPSYEGMKPMTTRGKQKAMGDISNLITDMTIKGANESEIAAAVRHSMTVIDAEKHNLNYRQSAIDNNIASLKTKYQGGPTNGASTLLSRAKSPIRIDEVKDNFKIDPTTGKKVFTSTGREYINKKGVLTKNTSEIAKLANTDDANTLSSGSKVERIYANHSNKLKSLADKARLTMITTPNMAYSPSAKNVYAKEVSSLDAKLNIAMRNAPVERQAQNLANKIISKKTAGKDLSPDQLKKVRYKSLNDARIKAGASKLSITITDKEWEAIQAGAISSKKLEDILNNTDLDAIKKRATPKTSTKVSAGNVSRIKQMLDMGYTQAEIADTIGIPVTAIRDVMKDV